MITVPEVVEKIVNKTPFLSEMMENGLINTSALARILQPELKKYLLKDVSESAIVMALKRLEPTLKSKKNHKKLFISSPEMIVRSHLLEITVANSSRLNQKLAKILLLYSGQHTYFFTVTGGITETTIIASHNLLKPICDVLKREQIISQFSNLSAITIRLPQEAIETPGVYYFFLKTLAMEGINILEVVSTYLEFTLILEDKDINKSFTAIKALFQK